jgi:hypothetical protein
MLRNSRTRFSASAARGRSAWIGQGLAIAIAIAAPAAHALPPVCVSNSSELQSAMTLSETLPQTIELERGTYTLGFGNIPMADGSSLRGGYAPGCTSRNIELGNTVMTANGSLSPHGNLTIEGLTWHGSFGISHDADFDPDVAPGSEVLIRRSAFVDSGDGGGISVFWNAEDDGVTIRIVDTVVANNALANGEGIYLGVLDDESLVVELINDTVVNNTQGTGVKVEFEGSGATLYAYNSIFYGNDASGAHDLISDSNFLVLVDNVIGTHSYPTPFFLPIGTQTSDPRLGADYRPIESPPSPVINSATSDVRGGLPSTDLPGRARVVGTAPDRGAFESSIDNSFLQSVSSTSDAGVGSLRSAILGANAHGSGLITFDLGTGCGPHTITLDSPLPAITVPLIINGYTQAGASANDLDVGTDARFCVILESGNATVTKALQISTGAGDGASLFVEGLAFSAFSEAAIALGSGSGSAIIGNRFGGSVGSHQLTANGAGIRLDANSHDTTVGGLDAADRNIISGSDTGSGIDLFGSLSGTTPTGTHDNQILNNLIGVDWTGDASGSFTPLGNHARGIYLAGHDNEISGNWIGDNAQAGIAVVNGGAQNNTIENNFIGFIYNNAQGNGAAGIHMSGDAGDAPTANVVRYNTIAANNGQGVWVEIGRQNRIRRNSIYDNTALGIDLVDAGVLPNDTDADSQPPDYANRGLNYPVLTSATGGTATGIFVGELESTLGDYRIDFYQTIGGCSATNRQAEFWIGVATESITLASVGGDGFASFRVQLDAGDFGSLIPGAGITATATDSANNTSELSACIPYGDDTIFANGFEPLI